MFQTGFPSMISSTKLHIRQVFVRPILLTAASLARLAAASSIFQRNDGGTNAPQCHVISTYPVLLLHIQTDVVGSFFINHERKSKRLQMGISLSTMVIGHGTLRSYYYRFKIKDDPECVCRMGSQTTEHITFWCRNYFFNFSTTCIYNVNKTGTKYVRIMKQTAF